MPKTAEFTEYEPKSIKELYGTVNKRQITALMFHDEMADLFDFLGLKGFKRMHEFQYLSESVGHRLLKRYYLNHHGMLLPDDGVTPVDVIPDDWYKYTRMDVTPAVRKQAVQKAMEQYKQWETDTKALYETCASYLLAWRNIADYEELCCYIKDVDEELKCLERLYIELQAVEYDMTYIETLQEEYHDRYKEKTKKVAEDLA